jgi:hypothetical protein
MWAFAARPAATAARALLFDEVGGAEQDHGVEVALDDAVRAGDGDGAVEVDRPVDAEDGGGQLGGHGEQVGVAADEQDEGDAEAAV